MDTSKLLRPDRMGKWWVRGEAGSVSFNERGEAYVWGPDGDAVALVVGGYGAWSYEARDNGDDNYETAEQRADVIVLVPDLLAEVERLRAEVTAYENQLTDVENEVERLEGVVAERDKRIEFLEGQGRLFAQQLWEYRKAERDA